MAAKKIFSFALIWLLFLVLISASWATAKTFQAKETDLVRIVPEAIDPNNDQIHYYYTPPLNGQGEWQTTYGDAGEYTINITASDGVSQTMQRIKLIIDKKNRAPIITEKKIVVKETQTIDLKSIVKDPDGDPLSYTFNPPFDRNGQWKTKYGDAGTFVTNFGVSDGESAVKGRVEIEVIATNRAPVIVSSFYDNYSNNNYSNTHAGKIDNGKLLLREGEALNYYVQANDSDGDSLSLEWKLDQNVISTKSHGKYYFDFNSSGEHILEVSVSDGVEATTEAWAISVKNVMQKPELHLQPIIVREGEKIILNLPKKDQEGNTLSYTLSGAGTRFNTKGEWQTDYNDSGEYKLSVVAANEDASTSLDVDITILEVDRPPVLSSLPVALEANEGELINLKINADDPDGDSIKLTAMNLPAGAEFNNNNNDNNDNKAITWTPSYDTVKREANSFNNFLNALRLEHYFLTTKAFPINITGCSKGLCISKIIKIIVHNKNRAPEFVRSSLPTIKETETVRADAEAVDSDGDIVRYYYTIPLGTRTGKWKTNYGDKGNYPVYVTATDGYASTIVPLNLSVLKKDRAPSLSIRNDDIKVNEMQEFTLKLSATDPDGDNLTLSLEELPPGASFKDGFFVWSPNYDTVKNKTTSWWSNLISKSDYLNRKFSPDKAIVWLSFVASDGEIDTLHPVKVTVKNVNRAPQIVDYLPSDEAVLPIGTPIIFHVAAKDLDNGKLNFEWDFGLGEKEVKGTDTIERTFTSLGKKKIKVTVDDGRNEVEKEWNVQVVNAPVLPVEEPFTIKVYVIEQNRSS